MAKARKSKANTRAAAGADPARPDAGAAGSPAPAPPAADAAGENAPERDRPAVIAGGAASAAPPADTPAIGSASIVRIAARRDGFRRAGLAHSKTPTDHPAERFTAEQLVALQAEPMLDVQLIREAAS